MTRKSDSGEGRTPSPITYDSSLPPKATPGASAKKISWAEYQSRLPRDHREQAQEEEAKRHEEMKRQQKELESQRCEVERLKREQEELVLERGTPSHWTRTVRSPLGRTRTPAP